jgi:hypothetical protein
MFRAKALTVMIASPSDVADERRAVADEVHRWNDANAVARRLVLLPVMWETHSTPQMGEPPQEILNRQLLSNADILVGIFGARIGTPTAEFVSGSVEEIKKHVAAGKTAKVYFSDAPISRDGFNPEQYAAVEKFRAECKQSGLYASFKDTSDFRSMFRQHLDIELNQLRYLWLPDIADGAEEIRLSDDAHRLAKAVADDDGVFIVQETVSGAGLRVGDEEFMDGTPRSAAQWRAVVSELLGHGAIEEVSQDVYRLTQMGYNLADERRSLVVSDTSAFDAHQDRQMRVTVEGLNQHQRDLLRLAVLHGGKIQTAVVHNNWKSSTPFDFNGLIRQPMAAGLIDMKQDHSNGTATLGVNEALVPILKSILFPRKEEQPSFFSQL